jgi:predicted lipoprotein with Yx(FWY)xxD motif
MRRLPTLALIAGVTSLAGLTGGLAACGSSSGTSANTQTTTPATEAASGSGSVTTSAPGATELKVSSSSLGNIVVDGEGRTLYVFTADNGTTTACTGGCAAAWPALVGTVTAGSGVTGTIGEATQADGAKQVTLNGHLLYYYASDSAPGATTGQGVGGKWFVVDGTGNAIKKTAASSSGY